MRTLLTCSLLAAACGGSAPATLTPAPAGAPGVAGHWVGDCTPAPQADGSTAYFTLDFHNTADHWQVAYTLFGDPACRARLVVVGIDGTYELHGPAAVPGAREAVFHFAHKTITPEVPPLAAALDKLGCGNGAVGVPRDVYAAGCPGFGQYPQATCSADYDVVWVSGDRLRFGKRPADNNMCSPDRRPTQLMDGFVHAVP